MTGPEVTALLGLFFSVGGALVALGVAVGLIEDL
jgi:hypothetical protein